VSLSVRRVEADGRGREQPAWCATYPPRHRIKWIMLFRVLQGSEQTQGQLVGELAAMEALDEHLFDVLLSFLTPRDALCLGGVSKSLRDLAGDMSPRWKDWCEKACPALMTFPAKELVAHFEKEYEPNNGPAFYRGLFLRMNKARGYEIPRFGCYCEPGSGPDVGEFLTLMDVFSLDGECIAGIVFSNFENFGGRRDGCDRCQAGGESSRVYLEHLFWTWKRSAIPRRSWISTSWIMIASAH
jgi:hypothetical protein